MAPEALVKPHLYDPKCECDPCASFTRYRRENPHLYGMDDARLVTAWMRWAPIRNALTCLAVIVACIVGIAWAWTSRADAQPLHAPAPIKAPTALLRERAECQQAKQAETCLRGKLRTAYAGLEWARKERNTRNAPYGVQHAIRLASALYNVPLAEFKSVINCESHGNPRAKNRHSSATGLMQWLDSSWASQGLPGFSRTDPYASVLAAGRAVVRDHGWSQWVCKP